MAGEKYNRDKGEQFLNDLNKDLVSNLRGLGDLGGYILEFGFGEIFQRELLTLREKEMITLAILISQGRNDQVFYHFQIALKIGIKPEELEDLIIQTVLYTGFPASMSAMKILNELKEKY